MYKTTVTLFLLLSFNYSFSDEAMLFHYLYGDGVNKIEIGELLEDSFVVGGFDPQHGNDKSRIVSYSTNSSDNSATSNLVLKQDYNTGPWYSPNISIGPAYVADDDISDIFLTRLTANNLKCTFTDGDPGHNGYFTYVVQNMYINDSKVVSDVIYYTHPGPHNWSQTRWNVCSSGVPHGNSTAFGDVVLKTEDGSSYVAVMQYGDDNNLTVSKLE